MQRRDKFCGSGTNGRLPRLHPYFASTFTFLPPEPPPIQPRPLLRLDATGAFVSAAVAAFAWARPGLFGAPAYNLAILCVFALGICAYGTYFVTRTDADWAFHLRRVSKANLVFVGLSGVLLLRWWPLLTTLGRVYFIAEVAIVLALVRYEYWVLAKAGA